jgi:hypothetical protein
MLQWWIGLMGYYEFMPSNELLTLSGQFYCNEQAITADICANILFIVAGFDSAQINKVSVTFQCILRNLQIQLADTVMI